MEYNTSRNHLEMPEYGRNIQKMVDHIKTVENRDERNRLAKALIQIMGSMNPHLRDVADFTHKLWDHLFIIANFDLDVDSPYPTPTKEEIYQKPERLEYHKPDDIHFKHYGKTLETMIAKAITYPEGEEKDYLIELICTQMKKSYVTWNRENVTDEQIFANVQLLSKNKLAIPEGLKLKEVRDLIPKAPQKDPQRKSTQKPKSQQNSKQQYKRKKV